MMGYREVLQDILEFNDGRRLLHIADVSRYTGYKDYRTLRKHFPFNGDTIAAPVLAMAIVGRRTKK